MKYIITTSALIFMCTLLSCDNGRTSNTSGGTNATPGTTNPDTQQMANGQQAAGVTYDSMTSGKASGSTRPPNAQGTTSDNTGGGASGNTNAANNGGANGNTPKGSK